VKILANDAFAANPVSSPAGTMIAIGGHGGIRLVSDHGGVSRALSVPGAHKETCEPARWWTTATILASCGPNGTAGKLWLVPADGTTPVLLTTGTAKPRPFDGWRLRSGLYLQAIGPNGTGRIYRQPPNGPVQPVAMPGTRDNWIATAYHRRLLVTASRTSCSIGRSLEWFWPSTGHKQALFTPPRGRVGLIGAVPFGQLTGAIYVGIACAY
jgi:hypothetical protein